MINVTLLTERDDINHILPACIQFARSESVSLPFQYMHMPLIWWHHFNNRDGSFFGQKRGKNFLGQQSQLDRFYLLIVKDCGVLCGAVPLVSYALKLPGEKHNYRMLTFAGDYITAICQDFLVLPEKRSKIIPLILEKILNFFASDHDLISFGFMHEHSKNISHIRKYLSGEVTKDFKHQELTTSRRGGVWPWTLDSIKSACGSMLEKIEKDDLHHRDMESISDQLSKSTSFSLLFPKNRIAIQNELSTILERLSKVTYLEKDIEKINACLKSTPITYPYIDLPPGRDEYFQTLSKSKRYYFRRYLRKFQESGGGFEKIAASDITENDIADCIRLHVLRWGKESAVICGDAANFHRDLGLAMAEEGMFTIFFATYNGKRIAAHTCFDINQRREFYLPGRDPEYENSRAGILLVMETILDAIDNGFSVYDLGVVGFSYKMDFTKTVYTTRNFFIYRNSFSPDLDKFFSGFECMD